MKKKKIPEQTQSEESETKSFNFLRLLRGSMKSCRIWPDETFNFILFWIITIFIIIPNILFVVLHEIRDVEYIVAIAQTFPFTGIGFKYIYFYSEKKKLKKLIDNIEDCYTKSLQHGPADWKKSVELMQRNLYRVEISITWITFIAMNFILLPLFITMIRIYVGGEGILIENYVKLHYGFGLLSPKSFDVGYIVLLISFWVFIFVNLCFEVIPFFLIYCIAQYFNFVKLRLIQWDEKHRDKSYLDLQMNRVQNLKELGKVIDEHCTALSLANDVEEFANPIALYYVLSGTLVLCLTSFTLTVLSKELIILSLLHLMKEITTQYCLSFIATKLISNSECIAETIQNFSWYEHPPVVRKAFLFIITNSQKPKAITAGKFYRVSLQSYTTIISTAFSYFTLLQKIYKSN